MPRSLPRLARALVVAGLLAGLATACGGDDPPLITIAPPPADPGPAVPLDLDEDPSGAFAFDQWPSACNLVNDGVLMAVFPQVEEIQRTGSNREVETVDESGAPQIATATSADCKVELGFPIDGLRVADAPGAELRISVLAAGTPEHVEATFDAPDVDLIDLDGGDCYVADATVSCRTPMVVFSLTLDITAPSQGGDEATIRYAVGPEDRYEFRQAIGDEGTEEHERRVAFLNEQAVVPLASTVVGRLGG